MTTKSINRGHILRAAWSHARLVAETLGKPIREFIGATMRAAWAIAKGRVPAPIPEMIPQQVQQQQANAGAPASMLEAVHGPNGADDTRLGDLASLRDLLRACWDQRAFQALLGDSDDATALCETIGGVEDLYRRLAALTGQRTDIYDREHPDRVAADRAWVEAGGGIPF